VHPLTVHRVLSRYGPPRLSRLDQATGRVIGRYEHTSPGDLVHADVKKIGRFRRWRLASARPGGPPNHHRGSGHAFLHTAPDDHSRLAYSEPLADERQETAAAFWARAHAYLAGCGITVYRELTDNGSCYGSGLPDSG
jgi:Integrase core domain